VAVIARMLARRVLILVPLLLGVILFVFIVMRFSSNKPEYAYFQGTTRCRCGTSGSSATCSKATWVRAC
jgi:ABC-type dipeptide/oligopeptide/nickel transport system permease component